MALNPDHSKSLKSGVKMSHEIQISKNIFGVSMQSNVRLVAARRVFRCSAFFVSFIVLPSVFIALHSLMCVLNIVAS
jgi:hypothetical protein